MGMVHRRSRDPTRAAELGRELAFLLLLARVLGLLLLALVVAAVLRVHALRDLPRDLAGRRQALRDLVHVAGPEGDRGHVRRVVAPERTLTQIVAEPGRREPAVG